MGFRDTMIGNPTGKSPEQNPIKNPNEGYGNWKNEMGKVQPVSAEEKAKREAESRAYEEEMINTVRERVKDLPEEDPQTKAQREMKNMKRGIAIQMPAVTPELIAQYQAQEAKKKMGAAKGEQEGVKGFFKRLFS